MSDCIFCKIINQEIPSYKVYENENVYAFFDINPFGEYHTLVIPKKHYQDIFDTPQEELQSIIGGIKEVVKIYEKKLGISDVQIFNNSGFLAQQEVGHIHFHILPRQKGDGLDIKRKVKEEAKNKLEELFLKLK